MVANVVVAAVPWRDERNRIWLVPPLLLLERTSRISPVALSLMYAGNGSDIAGRVDVLFCVLIGDSSMYTIWRVRYIDQYYTKTEGERGIIFNERMAFLAPMLLRVPP